MVKLNELIKINEAGLILLIVVTYLVAAVSSLSFPYGWILSLPFAVYIFAGFIKISVKYAKDKSTKYYKIYLLSLPLILVVWLSDFVFTLTGGQPNISINQFIGKYFRHSFVLFIVIAVAVQTYFKKIKK